MLRREFRVLLPPKSLKRRWETGVDLCLTQLRGVIKDLARFPLEPCRLDLVTTEQPDSPDLEFFKRCGGRVVSADSRPLPAALTESTLTVHDLDILSTALSIDADFVALFQWHPAARAAAGKIGVQLGTIDDLRTECEIFLRGHDLPVSLRELNPGLTWKSFYPWCERDNLLHRLFFVAQRSGAEPQTVEITRSMAFDRHSALCYTRDKLLFLLQQDAALKRKDEGREALIFHLGYYLNHYYLLLWAGLGEICKLVNNAFELHVKNLNPLSPVSLQSLRLSVPEVAEVFEREEFRNWMKLLRTGRNIAAHQGFLIPNDILFEPEEPIREEELEREARESGFFKLFELAPEMFESLPRQLSDDLELVIKHNARMRRYRRTGARVIIGELDGKQVLLNPLPNVRSNFELFTRFSREIASRVIKRLEALGLKR